MTQSQKMRYALKEQVVPHILAEGFTGEYPHFRRAGAHRVDLLSFGPYKYGNAVCVEVSVVYPERELRQRNLLTLDFDGDYSRVTVGDCGGDRYSLKSRFGDRFYYTTVYRTQVLGGVMYEGISETRARSFRPKWHYKLMQVADEGIYDRVCQEILKGLPKAWKWINGHPEQ